MGRKEKDKDREGGVGADCSRALHCLHFLGISCH